jgi:hypothetical protein
VGPALIRRGDVTRHVWGDPDSGEVFDWIYDLIHMLVFGVAPGGAFRHSEAYRTVFAADEVLHVLEGTLVIADPQTGEVERVATARACSSAATRGITRARGDLRRGRARASGAPDRAGRQRRGHRSARGRSLGVREEPGLPGGRRTVGRR